MSGHVGQIRTAELIRRSFQWYNLVKDVDAFVSSCHQCQTNKASNQKSGGALQPVEIPENNWECVSMDLITSLPKTRRGNDAITVYVDKLSKMCHLAACETASSAEETAQLFMHEVHRLHGMPRKIVSDRDGRFTGNFMVELTRLMGTRQAFSTSFHPQTDGQTERMNRVLEDMLRHYVGPYHNDWDDYLGLAEFAINNAFQVSIQNTPFMMVYGQHPHTPASLAISTRVPSVARWAQSYNVRLAAAKLKLKAAQDRQKEYADRSRRDVKYILGQQVLLSTKNMKFKGDGVPKLMPKWIGPFEVSQLVGPRDAKGDLIREHVRAVQLVLPPLMRVHNVFHVSLIKEYKENGESRPLMPLEFDADGSPQWEVLVLLKKRQSGRGKRKTEFLVRWKGFGPEHDSWEPIDHITCKTLIDDFNRKEQGLPTLPIPMEIDEPPAVPVTTRVTRLQARSGNPRAEKVTLAIVLPGKLYLGSERLFYK